MPTPNPTIARLDAARRTLEQALAGLVPYPEMVRRAFEDLIAAKVQAMAEGFEMVIRVGLEPTTT